VYYQKEQHTEMIT